MTGLIVRHEWQLMRRQRWIGWTVVLLLVATVYALVGGLRWQDTRNAETAAIHSENAALLEQQKANVDGQFGGRVGGIKTFAAMPPGPLAAFSIGLADLFPQRAEISVWKRPDTLFGRYQLQSPLSLLVGRFDLGFVVLYLLPLFVLALSYDLLATERERGTLALVLVQPVSLRRVFVAKLLARLALLTGFLVLTVVVGGVVAGLSADAWPRLAGWLAVAWLYGLFWLAASGLVAGWCRRAETCATALAGLWLAVVLVIPGLLNVAVQSASPVPSRLELVTTMRAASSDASKASAELLAQYYHEHPELSANGRQSGFMPSFYAAERDVERRLEPLMTDFDQRLAEQQRLVTGWRFLSPAVLAQEAFLDLAGSGLERQRSAAHQARTLLADWHGTLAPKLFLGTPLVAADYDTLPTFSFTEPPVSLQRFAFTMLGLTLPSFMALWLAWRRLDRFSVAA